MAEFVRLEVFTLNVSSLSFITRLNQFSILHHPNSLFSFGLLLPLWRFSALANNYFKIPFTFIHGNNIGKMTQNIVT